MAIRTRQETRMIKCDWVGPWFFSKKLVVIRLASWCYLGTKYSSYKKIQILELLPRFSPVGKYLHTHADTYSGWNNTSGLMAILSLVAGHQNAVWDAGDLNLPVLLIIKDSERWCNCQIESKNLLRSTLAKHSPWLILIFAVILENRRIRVFENQTVLKWIGRVGWFISTWCYKIFEVRHRILF